MVQRARRAVVFTGAGISTECGIPDFRSPGGFWTRYKPIAYQEFLASEDTRLEAWRRFLMIRETIGMAEPGPSHQAVARLVDLGHVARVITQNIDGTYARCLGCGLRHEIDWVKDEIDRTGRAPACTSCSGVVKSATISFGQSMPEQEMADARAATLDADLFIAVGSSLQVFPAAGFPVLASHNRTPLVILNREETGLDGLARLVIHAESGPVLAAVVSRIAAV